MKTFFLFFFLTPSAFAIDAVITVLEAPLFKYRSLNAPVVQYLRKGDKLYVHPSLNNTGKYDHMAPGLEKQTEIEKSMKEGPEWKEDALFKGDRSRSADIEDEFIPTLDRNGQEAFVLSEHIYVYLETPSEFIQRPKAKDPTDYRLTEPLPKDYPLYTISGYRGQFLLGTTQPYLDSYPYKSDIKTKGYQSPVDMIVTLMKRTPHDLQDRLYFGGSIALKTFSNTYRFTNNTTSEEKGFKFGIGPTISYDAYKGEDNRINLNGGVLVNLFNQLDITQHALSGVGKRQYRGFNLTPRLGVQYHRKNIFENIDFVVGSAFEIETSTRFAAKDAGRDTTIWRNVGNDTFSTRTLTTLSVAFGVQSAY